MLKYLVVLTAALTLNAQEVPKKPQTGGKDPIATAPPPGGREFNRPQLTEEQKKQRDAIVSKYDANKDGVLNKEERAKVSDEDRMLLRSFGPPLGGPRGPKRDGPPPTKDGDRPGKPHKKKE